MATPVWKRILKWSAWLLGGVLALPIVCYVALLLINLRDQSPSEAALRLAADYRSRPAIADADNAYIYVIGFAVAPDADPSAAGIRRIEWMRTLPAVGEFPLSNDPVTPHEYRSSRSPVVQKVSAACPSGSKDCAVALESSDDELRTWLTSEQWLLDRYLTLLQHPRWQETVPFDTRLPMPNFTMPFDGQKLLMAHAYLLAGQNDAAQVRELLGKDARFWRSVLASSDILITKMIAVGALNRTFVTGNLVLRRLPAELQSSAIPEEWTLPLSDDERSMLRCLTGEWIWASHMLDQTMVGGAFGEIAEEADNNVFGVLMGHSLTPLFQLQDSKNRHADMFIRASAALNVPFEDFAKGLEQARTVYDDAYFARNRVANLYNPAGRMLLGIAAPSYESYPQRVNDVEGVRRAAVLATELRTRKVAHENISEELAASQIRTPYTAEPFTWSAKEQAIVFVGMNPGERGRHTFKY